MGGRNETYAACMCQLCATMVNRFYETFDFPEPSETHGAREVTTVAPQALFLMNNDFVMRRTRSWRPSG